MLTKSELDKLNVFGVWDEDESTYKTAIEGTPLYSDDGDNWTPDGAYTALPPHFESAKITLCGGPRDGEEVM